MVEQDHRIAAREPPQEVDLRVEALVAQLIGRVADKWTMLILEELTEAGKLRFTRLSERVSGISQKMLTLTLRQMEPDGLVLRGVYAVVPPRVEYRLTELGSSLGAAFYGVWIWADQHLDRVQAARRAFDARSLQHHRPRSARPTDLPADGAGLAGPGSRMIDRVGSECAGGAASGSVPGDGFEGRRA